MDALTRMLASRFHFKLKKIQMEDKQVSGNAEGVKPVSLQNQQETIQPGIEGSSNSKK